MKITKSWLLSIMFLGLFAFSSYANANPKPLSNETINKQISKYLEGLDEAIKADSKTILVDFMVTEKAEIMVVSTNDKNLDATIKYKLNYKALSAPQLEMYKKYTIPVVIKK